MNRVAVVRGRDRRKNIIRVLETIERDIRPGKRILIKPNLVSTTKRLATTHVEALRGVIHFLKERTDAEITIGEGSSTRDTFDAYDNFGYRDLVREFGVKLIDFNREAWVKRHVFDDDLGDIEVRLARAVVESDYRISVCPPKTHDVVVVTLSLKNMVVGSLIRDELGMIRTFGGLAWQLFSTFILKRKQTLRFVEGYVEGNAPLIAHSDKIAIHRGYPAINMTLARLAPFTFPHLAVIDGVTGMEGNGPTQGSAVDLGLAIAGTDFLAVDSVTARIMGFDPEEIGYMVYMDRLGLGTMDMDGIEIIGERLETCIRPFRPHADRDKQADWRLEGGAEGEAIEHAVRLLRNSMDELQTGL